MLALGTGAEVGYTFRLIEGKQTIATASWAAHCRYMIITSRGVDSSRIIVVRMREVSTRSRHRQPFCLIAEVALCAPISLRGPRPPRRKPLRSYPRGGSRLVATFCVVPLRSSFLGENSSHKRCGKIIATSQPEATASRRVRLHNVQLHRYPIPVVRSRFVRFRVWNTSPLVILTAAYLKYSRIL